MTIKNIWNHHPVILDAWWVLCVCVSQAPSKLTVKPCIICCKSRRSKQSVNLCQNKGNRGKTIRFAKENEIIFMNVGTPKLVMMIMMMMVVMTTKSSISCPTNQPPTAIFGGPQNLQKNGLKKPLDLAIFFEACWLLESSQNVSELIIFLKNSNQKILLGTKYLEISDQKKKTKVQSIPPTRGLPPARSPC